MPEFGHFPVNGAGLCFDRWGAGPFLIIVDGKAHRFEDSDRFGPIRVDKNGAIPSNDSWPEGHRFWKAHAMWVRAGRPVEPDGRTCIWTEPKPTIVRHVAGRHWIVVERGDDIGLFVDEQGKPIGRIR